MASSAALPSILVFAATYLVLAIGRLPGFRVDRTRAAIIGATLMVPLNVVTVADAVTAINTDTILLLFGRMIVVANLRLSGFFALVSEWVVQHAHRPLMLLVMIVAVSGVFSAFFVNDSMCLVLTPLVLEITTQLRRNPVPYVLAVAMASNIGSVATATGNPQNMLIASFSGIHYRGFAAALSPVALAGLAALIAIVTLAYRVEFLSAAPRVTVKTAAIRVHRALMWKSTIASAWMIVLFFLGWPIAKVALVAGALLLVTRCIKPERVYAEIDWSRLVLFIGLFIVVRGWRRPRFPATCSPSPRGYIWQESA
jgi:Na+/H+ antiporter NhaD/arsenite permease-like protein